jgi:hypothetical protein
MFKVAIGLGGLFVGGQGTPCAPSATASIFVCDGIDAFGMGGAGFSSRYSTPLLPRRNSTA